MKYRDLRRTRLSIADDSGWAACAPDSVSAVRRAKVIAAEGEFQAAAKLSEASDILSKNPMALQLRYLQTMSEMASEKSSTIVFPLPLDLISPLIKKLSD